MFADYSKFKKEAIRLRKSGFTYSEILKKIPVAKSTLSLWLRSVNLASRQKQRINFHGLKGRGFHLSVQNSLFRPIDSLSLSFVAFIHGLKDHGFLPLEINKKLAKNYWSKNLNLEPKELKIYLKRNKIVKKKRKLNKKYYGMVRLRVKRSTNLNRRISGWIRGIQLGVV